MNPSIFCPFIFVVMTTLAMTSYGSCPSVCRCSGGVTDCTYANIVSMPKDLQVNGGTADFSFNVMVQINKTSLENFTNVEIIKLYHNHLLYVEPYSFKHLTSLRELDFGNNNLTNLPSNVFAGLTELETLYMDTNDVSYIAPLVFIQSTKLRRLDLQWNQLTMPVLEGLYLPSSIEELNLAYNQITALKSTWWRQLESLKHLYLGANPIKQLYSTSFGVMPSLLVIHLGNKELDYIEPSTFDRMFSLSRFSLSSSGYTYLPVSLLSECKQTLQSIDMAAAPIRAIEPFTFSNFHFVNTINLVNMTDLRVIHSKAFYNMTSLQILQIRKCPLLRYFERNAFMHLPLLARLDLSDNGLVTLSAELLTITDSVVFIFKRNTWRCDCNILTLYNNTVNAVTKKSFDDTFRCASPIEVKGQGLSDVSLNIDLCSDSYRIVTTYQTISDKNSERKGEQMAPLHTSAAPRHSTNLHKDIIIFFILYILLHYH